MFVKNRKPKPFPEIDALTDHRDRQQRRKDQALHNLLTVLKERLGDPEASLPGSGKPFMTRREAVAIAQAGAALNHPLMLSDFPAEHQEVAMEAQQWAVCANHDCLEPVPDRKPGDNVICANCKKTVVTVEIE